MAQRSVKELTTSVSEIKLGDIGWHVLHMRDLLAQAGIDSYSKYDYYDPNEFDENLEQSVMLFQEQEDLPVTGIIDDNTFNSINNIANNMSDIIYSENAESAQVETSDIGHPKYDSYFSSSKLKTTRRNNQDILITLGNNTVTKTIHNVYMRGVSMEFDTSGNPISEVCEFIAEDITESDEYTDEYKYD